MSIQKECADALRLYYRNLTGEKLRSGHAHQLVAAYFGYGTAAALQADNTFPVSALASAEILIPDIKGMDRRRSELPRVPANLPDGKTLAEVIATALEAAGHLKGDIWDATNLQDEIDIHVHRNTMVIEDDLAGEIAMTNAYFDELIIDDADIEFHEDSLIATLSGDLNGDQDQDKAFHGDKIRFSSIMTMRRAAGRIGYFRPEFESEGKIDDSMYYGPDED